MGRLRINAAGRLRIIVNQDDNDVVTIDGELTDLLADHVCRAAEVSVELAELSDHELDSLLRSELAVRCRRLNAYSVFQRWRDATIASRAFADVVADPAYQVRRRYSSESGEAYTEIKTKDTTPLERRSAESFREYWVQQYTAKNFERLGFDGMKGPFEHGPDFRLRRNGRWHVVEVETIASTFFKHGHHRDTRWSTCKYLVVLENDLSDERLKQAPSVIVVEREHFDAWCRPAMQAYAAAKEPQRKDLVVEHQLRGISNVFRALVVETCARRDGDMAMCPDCDRCPYFGDGDMGGSGADRYFLEMSGRFLEHVGGRVTFAKLVRFFDEFEGWQMTGIAL